jgi:hypothetical protein
LPSFVHAAIRDGERAAISLYSAGKLIAKGFAFNEIAVIASGVAQHGIKPVEIFEGAIVSLAHTNLQSDLGDELAPVLAQIFRVIDALKAALEGGLGASCSERKCQGGKDKHRSHLLSLQMVRFGDLPPLSEPVQVPPKLHNFAGFRHAIAQKEPAVFA